MSIATNLRSVLDRMAEACARAGRPVEAVRLVAVSKTHTPDEIRQAHAAGQRLFGENYSNELEDKAVTLADLDDLEWHFIGHLQRNKVGRVLPHVSMIQTLDSTRLLETVVARASEKERPVRVLIEVNMGRESQKAGVLPEDVERLLVAIDGTSWVSCAGLMVLPPFELDPEEVRPWFAGLRTLRDRLGGPARLPELSMGMSADFGVAIEEGATLVRVGTAIFGPRKDREIQKS